MHIIVQKICLFLIVLFLASDEQKTAVQQKIFDTHLHFKNDLSAHLQELEKYNIAKGAISGSWERAVQYHTGSKQKLLIGLMLPCPNGTVPYHGAKCFENGKEYPDTGWVRQQILDHKIDFFGELLNEYYGISLSEINSLRSIRR